LDLRKNSGVLHPLMAGKRETQVEIIFSVMLYNIYLCRAMEQAFNIIACRPQQ
jgi:hypothetical protein